VEWDDDTDGSRAMSRADVMISETSNARLDFALLYERPVVTLKVEMDELETFEISDIDGAWMPEAERAIGAVVGRERMDDIAAVVRDTISGRPGADLRAFRSDNVYNFGKSGRVIAEYVSKYAPSAAKEAA
jgi:hypothetical protein